MRRLRNETRTHVTTHPFDGAAVNSRIRFDTTTPNGYTTRTGAITRINTWSLDVACDDGTRARISVRGWQTRKAELIPEGTVTMEPTRDELRSIADRLDDIDAQTFTHGTPRTLANVAAHAIITAAISNLRDAYALTPARRTRDAVGALYTLDRTQCTDEPGAAPRYTAWITTDGSCLDTPLCDVQVLPDAVTHYRDGGDGDEVPVYESRGPAVFSSTLDTPHAGPHDGVEQQATEALNAAGWRVVGKWSADVPTGLIAVVERVTD